MTTRGRRPTLATAVLCAGCTTVPVPPDLAKPPEPDISVAQVQAGAQAHVGQRVRWGGTVLGVRNRAQTTEVEVLSRPLSDDGVPSTADGAGLGRFVAVMAGFVDPVTFPKDYRVTVAGEVARVETRNVGDYPYAYPVVTVRHYRTFAPPAPPAYWNRYPYYGPAYPWGPWWGPGPWYRPWPWPYYW